MSITWGSLIGLCSHDRTTWPQTKRGETHITCLECGKEFAYSWGEMRIIGKREEWQVEESYATD